MSKFKVGPCKTRGGRDAVIYEISDKIYGKMPWAATGENLPTYWSLGGIFHSSDHNGDLVPNAEPFGIRAIVSWHLEGKRVYPTQIDRSYIPWIGLVGKRGVLTFTEGDADE